MSKGTARRSLVIFLVEISLISPETGADYLYKSRAMSTYDYAYETLKEYSGK